ncbi:MAG: BCCT family transporter, partial [Erysipelotrichaceae bacterium]|nr:BCCT family transporter [Erysipelotrichaceae bacterium]
MKINKKLFFPALIGLIVIIVAVATNLKPIQDAVTQIYNGCIDTFGWFFVFVNICCLLFALWIGFGPYRNVRLGGENAKAEFSTFSWAGMMFTTSCGAWLIVYGFLEPIYCSAQTAFGIEPLTTAGYEMGQAYAHFNWGPNAWCIYVPVSVAIGYAIYNRHAKKATIGEACREATNWKGGALVRYLADLVSLCASVLAPVISIGTGLPLLVYLVKIIFKLDWLSDSVIQIIILAVWIGIFSVSVYFGLAKGIKKLSNTNVILGFALMLAVGLFAGLFFVFSSEINTLGVFLSNFIRMSTYTDAFG